MPGITGIGINTGIGIVRHGARSNPLEYTQFIAATGISDSTQKAAALKLVKDLMSTGVWDKLKAIYPMIGGTSQSHKFNLKDSRDLDISFRLNFTTGWTHTTTGAKPNGLSAYASTFFNPLINGLQNSISIGYYSLTDLIAGEVEMGENSVTSGIHLLYSYAGMAFKSLNSESSARGSLYYPTNGLLICNRPDANTEKYYHKGVLKDLLSVPSTTPVNKSVVIGANSTTDSVYTSKECAFAFIGEGLTDADALNLYNSVQLFQTTLGRAI